MPEVTDDQLREFKRSASPEIQELIERAESDMHREIALAQLDAHDKYREFWRTEATRLQLVEGQSKEEAESEAATFSEGFWAELAATRDQEMEGARMKFRGTVQSIMRIGREQQRP